MIHPVDYEPSQDYGDNATRDLPADHWIIKLFGNYQPDGHTGTDYPCPVGTPVRAVTAGKVLHVGYIGGTYADNPWWIQPGFAGFFYAVDHGSFIGIYGHCAEDGARVKVGDTVAEGQVLGLSGNTGASTGAHLHFEILVKPFTLNSFMYGRSNPAILFGSASLGLASNIITQLEEAGVSLDLSDREFIQKVVQDNLTPVINEVRAHTAHWGTQLAQLIKDSTWEVKTFAQASDNFTGDRIIHDNRHEEAVTRGEVDK